MSKKISKKEKSAGQMISGGVKILIAGAVMLFLGLHSLSFFTFVFDTDKYYYAVLGFALTSGGVVAYLNLFLKDADTKLKKVISLVMVIVCVLGEVFTAGFGMQVESWNKGGYELLQSDIDMMILFVSILGFVHGIALLGYLAGDQIQELFADDDGDGVPNAVDPDYWKNRARAAEAEAQKLKKSDPKNARRQ